MIFRKMLLVWSLLFLSINANAGWYANTAHSRGNCFGFNESITWNWIEYHWWAVESIHFSIHGNGVTHMVTAPMSYTWRAAAFHVKEWEGPNGNNWWVQGYHYLMNYNGAVVYDAYTQSGDCNLYDGWWDKNKARGELKS